jgi:hypothetical protein
MRLQFHPTSPGVKHATLHITQDLGASIDQTFPIHATAIAAPAGLYVTTPDLFVAASSTLAALPSVMIVNHGSTAVDLGDPVVPAPFVFDSWNCPSPLTPGGACVATLRFGAATAGCPVGAFTTTTAAFTVPLTTRGVPSSLELQVYPSGSVRIDPVGVTCPASTSCPITLASPTALTLTALPDAGGHFLGWYETLTGALHACGTATTCSLPAVFASLALTARFASPQAKTIAITISGTGTVTSYLGSCSASCTLYSEGGSLTLGETTSGTFVGWSGDCTGTSTCNLGTIINDRSVTATFTP